MPRYVGQRIPRIAVGGELADDVLVDVRDRGEFAAGHAPESWSIPPHLVPKGALVTEP